MTSKALQTPSTPTPAAPLTCPVKRKEPEPLREPAVAASSTNTTVKILPEPPIKKQATATSMGNPVQVLTPVSESAYAPPPSRPRVRPANALDWTVEDVIDYLISCDQSLAPHAETFRKHVSQVHSHMHFLHEKCPLPMLMFYTMLSSFLLDFPS